VEVAVAAIENKNFTALGCAMMAAAVSLPMPGSALAEAVPERGMVGLKYLDYQESQPGDPRIKVQATAFTAMVPVAGEWTLRSTLTSDAISGASPVYHTTALQKMRDRRNALDASVTRYFPDGALTLGASYSTETDYLSRGLSVVGRYSNDSKNTTWSAGIGILRDTINPVNGIVENATKSVTDLMAGVTQVLTPNDIVQVNLGLSLGNGYFSDPYKVYDSRPEDHNRNTALVRWNHHLESTRATARLSYRYYSDNWGIRSHTLGAEYVQPMGQDWTVTPLLRYYTQSAADFYVEADPSTDPFPPNPAPDAIYSTEDQRMSAFGAITWGFKLERKLGADWLLDFKFENYGQRANWRPAGGGSTGLLPFNAVSYQLGVSRQF
jgi:hypothetical protein